MGLQHQLFTPHFELLHMFLKGNFKISYCYSSQLLQNFTMPFNVKEHIITCQRFKQHSNKLSSLLSVKQYSPSENVSPSKGDVTIIAAHGNGFVKVEPSFLL
jgi:hypothetical protein